MTETKLLPALSVTFVKLVFMEQALPKAWSLDFYCGTEIHLYMVLQTKQVTAKYLPPAVPWNVTKGPILTILPVGGQRIILEEANHTSLILGWQC